MTKENVITGKKGHESVKDMVERLQREKRSQEDRVAVFPERRRRRRATGLKKGGGSVINGAYPV